MLFRKSRIPRGYMLLEEIEHTKPRSAKSAVSRLLSWLATLAILFLLAFMFSEVTVAENIVPLVGSDSEQNSPNRFRSDL